MSDSDRLIEDHKADFSTIYNCPDPRQYFRTLSDLDYQIPQRALPVFDAVLDALPGKRQHRSVIDLCCSYGINAALIRNDVDLDQINAYYNDRSLDGLSEDEIIEADRRFFTGERHRDVDVIGLDVSQEAIDYGVAVRLLAGGWAENLETSDPSPELARAVAKTDLIISTGGVGYVGRPTFDRLLKAIEDPQDVWLAIFVLRVFDYSDIADLLTDYGLVTEQVPGMTFRQRRFADLEEQQAAIHDVTLRGLDPTGKEASGWFHADCFLTRPTAAVAELPITKLLARVEGDAN